MRTFLFLMLLLISQIVFAQHTNPLPTVQQKMQALKWLTGEWQGTAFVKGPDGKKQEFKQTLEFATKLNKTVLLINESSIQGQDTVSQAIGFLGYNFNQSKYNLEAFTKDGVQVEAYVEVLDNKIIWRYHFPGHIIRFTANLNEKGQWHQIGEMSADEGKVWTPFFESTLTRVK